MLKSIERVRLRVTFVYRKNRSNVTKKKYQSRKVTLEKLFGDKPISQIRPSEYQRIMNSYGQRVSRNFLSRLNTGVKQSLQVAIADKVMIEDFTQNVELFSTVKSGTIIMMEYRNFMQIIMSVSYTHLTLPTT
ncbi:hypothetical protein DAD55_05895 [Streptococcus agalactiae]|nr:hypothetical protein DAD55_05895 [Streptococcus agalactiae]